MTTSWPIPPPDNAFQWGGVGGDIDNWGQNLTESAVRAMGVPSIDPADPLGSLAALLFRLPLEALQFFREFIPEALEDTWLTVTGAVNNILNWLVPREVMLALAEFQAFLATLLANPGEVIGEIGQNMVEGLEAAMAQLTALGSNFSALLNDLLTNPGAVLGDLTQDMVNGLTGAINGLNTFIQDVVDGIITAIRGIPFVGGGIADLLSNLTGYREGVEVAQVVQQNFTRSSTSSIVRQPGWASLNPISAVSYPAILNSEWYVFADSVGPATAGTAHSHQIRGSTDDARAIGPWWSIPQNGSMGAFVTPTEDMVFSKFGFLAYSETAPPAGSLTFEILRRQPNGNIDRLGHSDVSSYIDTVEDDVVLAWTDFRVVARRGEQYLMRIKNTSSPDCVPRLKGLRWDTGVPPIQWETDNATDTNKTSYTNAEAEAIIASSFVTPWFMLAAEESDIPEVRTWVDDFNRDELGYFWNQSLTDTGGNLVINNGRLSYGGTTNGFEQALYIRQLATDGFKLEANVVGVNNAAAITFICAGGRTSQYSVNLSINGTQAQISTLIGGVLTVRDTVSRTGNDGKWSMTYDEATKVYTALFNDQDVGLSWTDSGNFMPKGVQYRYFEIQIQRTSGANAGEVEEWLIQDWTP